METKCKTQKNGIINNRKKKMIQVDDLNYFELKELENHNKDP